MRIDKKPLIEKVQPVTPMTDKGKKQTEEYVEDAKRFKELLDKELNKDK